MGAINFRTLTNKSRLALVNEPEREEEPEEQYFDDNDADFEEVKEELKKYNFYYFNLLVDFGYYEGFSLRLEEENTRWIYHNHKEKAEALKELTQIKNILIQFINNGLLKGAYPSWVTSYPTQADTIRQIKEIIKSYKEEIKSSYTEATAKRQNKSILDIIKEAEAKAQ